MDPSIYVVYSVGQPDLRCLHNGIILVNLRCLQYGPIQPFLQPDKHKPGTTRQVLL